MGHMEARRLGVAWELELSAYATATATQNPSHICNLHHSSQQHWVLNPLSKARNQTQVLMDTEPCWECPLVSFLISPFSSSLGSSLLPSLTECTSKELKSVLKSLPPPLTLVYTTVISQPHIGIASQRRPQGQSGPIRPLL